MSNNTKTCYLCSQDKAYPDIYLPDGTPISIGRTPETNIQDTKCSRQQVRVCASYADHIVTIQQIGLRACGLNGVKTQKGVKMIAQNLDSLEILYGQYPYIVNFNPPPLKTCESLSKKRSLDSEVLDSQYMESSKKIQKVESDTKLNTCKKSPVKAMATRSEKDSPIKTKAVVVAAMQESDNEIPKSGWESIDNGQLLIYTADNVEHRPKIAAYDMDGTLIKTRSGLVLPKDCSDWQLIYPDVPGKLKKLHTDEYKIVIFTNQAQIGVGKLKIDDFKFKIESVVKKIGVPIQVFVATSKTIYRKPATGMWQTLETKKNGGIPIDKDKSFYVGDAAGREKNWAPGKRKDHSLADRLLAMNLNLRFQTPEEHFFGQKAAPYQLPEFDPKSLSENIPVCDTSVQLISSDQEVVLMMGSPASGKSHFIKHHLKSYGYVSRDMLGSWQKCVKELEKCLSQNKSVVVDNTHGDPESRLKYIQIAKKRNIPVRCFIMTTSLTHAKHNNKFRELTDSNHQKISDIILHTYAKRCVPPTLDEGFTEIVKINFVPNFSSEETRKLYQMYLLER